MLSPDQVKEMRTKYGIPQVGLGGSSPASQGTPVNWDELDSISSQPTQTTPQESSSLGFPKIPGAGLVTKAKERIQTGGQRIVDTAMKGPEQKTIGEGVLQEAKAIGQVPLETFKVFGGTLGDLFTAALNKLPKMPGSDKTFTEQVSGEIASAFQRLPEPVKQKLSDVAAKADQNPALKEIAQDTFDLVVNTLGLGAGKLAEQGGVTVGKNIIKDITTVSEKKALSNTTKLATEGGTDTVSLFNPKVTAKVEKQALMKGSKGVEESGLLSKGQLKPDKLATDIDQAATGLVSPKNTPVQNIDNLLGKVNEVNTGVKEYVTANKVPFNRNQLRAYLKTAKEDSRLLFAGDESIEKTYDAVIDEFVKTLKAGDTEGLLEARQSFDKIPAVKKLLDSLSKAPGGENLRRSAVLDVRRAANEMISDLLPTGNPYKDALKQETLLLRGVERIAENAVGTQVGKNEIGNFIKRHPAIKWVASLTGAGLGGAIIGETIQ